MREFKVYVGKFLVRTVNARTTLDAAAIVSKLIRTGILSPYDSYSIE